MYLLAILDFISKKGIFENQQRITPGLLAGDGNK
jgi:hypothetical protein